MRGKQVVRREGRCWRGIGGSVDSGGGREIAFLPISASP